MTIIRYFCHFPSRRIAESPECERCSNPEERAEAFYYCSKVHSLWEYVEDLVAHIVSYLWTMWPLGLLKMHDVHHIFGSSQNVCGTPGRLWSCIEIHCLTLTWHDLIAYFKHQLRVKRYYRQRLTKEDFSNRWMKVTSLVCIKSANLGWLFF